MHFPDPLPPLLASLSAELIAAPFNKTAARYALPPRVATLWVNTYLYLSFVPEGAPPDIVLKAMNALGRVAPGVVAGLITKATASMTKKYMAQMEPVLGRLRDYWETEGWPELKQHLAYWEAFDMRGATPLQLLNHLDDSLIRLARVWEIHWQIVLPSFLALSLFDELYRELFGRDDDFGAYRLLQGFDNKFLEADRALWQLSRQALTMPKVRETLEACAPADVIPALKDSPEGEIFLAGLRRYLDEYGQRGHHADGLMSVSWFEDPRPALASLTGYMTQPDRDLECELKTQAAEREQWTAQARERLRKHPPSVVQRFETLLKAAQAAAFLHEEHHYWIDQRAQYQLRRILLEFGRRFAEAGLIAQPNDVFALTRDELYESVLARTALNWRTVMRERQAEMERFRAVNPPPFIGTMPLMQPPDEPFGRSMEKVMGVPPMPGHRRAAAEPDIVRGLPASPGLVRGRARVIGNMAEASRLQPGDVLVAEATTPTWTPLYALVSAVVTDVGGILSHAAVVAREYRIPAVVGTGTATAAIRDGQLVEVDGTAGLVRLVMEQA